MAKATILFVPQQYLITTFQIVGTHSFLTQRNFHKLKIKKGGNKMARKSHYIKNINNRDITALRALGNCGYVQRENLLNCITNSRINNYCKEGLIIKEVYVSNKNET